MSQAQPIVSYDEYMPKRLQERIKIFNEISAENRALLIKTHVERWLAANRRRLTREQVDVVEEIIPAIRPEWYGEERDYEKVTQEAEALRRKAEAVFPREDVIQIMWYTARHVPPVEDDND